MSDTVHFIPGGPMLRWDEARVRKIPCGAGRKKRDLVASTNPKDVDCARCLKAMRDENQQNSSEAK